MAQQQEGPRFPGGQEEPSHAYRLEPSGRQRGLETSQGRDVQGVTSPTDIVFAHYCLSTFTENDTWISYLPLSASVLNRGRLRHDVRMLNWLLLGDGDI